MYSTRVGRERWGVLGGLLLVLSVAPEAVRAQTDVERLATLCGGGDAVRTASCGEGALAAQAAQTGVALMASGGSQLTGASSTLGRRFDGRPRLSIGVRTLLARVAMPDLQGVSTAPFASGAFTGLGVEATVTGGLFNGFSLVPTVGGVLSLDVFAAAGLLLLPAGAGFEDNPGSLGVGVNVGLVRESFTLPGVTVSGAYRRIGQARGGALADGDAAELRVGPSVRSLRAVVGKDLVGLATLVGVGWDGTSGRTTLAVAGQGGSGGGVALDGFGASRTLLFGGVGLNLLVLHLSGEAGWARGHAAHAGRPSGGFDPAGGTPYLSLAGRLIL